MTTQSTTPVTDAELEAFRASCEANARRLYDAKYPAATHPHMQAYRPALVVERGSEWAKLIAVESNGGRRVFGFVKLATGEAYKAASFTKPATNFPRGHIRDGAKAEWVYGIA